MIGSKKHTSPYGLFAESLVELGFLQSVPYMKPILTNEKLFDVGKKWPKMPTFDLIFLGLGWPSVVGEFVGFMIIFGISHSTCNC